MPETDGAAPVSVEEISTEIGELQQAIIHSFVTHGDTIPGVALNKILTSAVVMAYPPSEPDSWDFVLAGKSRRALERLREAARLCP